LVPCILFAITSFAAISIQKWGKAQMDVILIWSHDISWAGDVAGDVVVKHLSGMHKALDSTPSVTTKQKNAKAEKPCLHCLWAVCKLAREPYVSRGLLSLYNTS
jgi:hypothetical protein